jgi:hypothetical protein
MRTKGHAVTIAISDLWVSTDPVIWDEALNRYWTFVKPANLDLERRLDVLELETIQRYSPHDWYDFLLQKYFRWKYTAPNRYATTTGLLKRYNEESNLDELDKIRTQLLNIDTKDIAGSLEVACRINGLGVAGASGLLSLMYPSQFATVDQFVVKALREVPNLAEASVLNRMNPEGLSKKNGVVLIKIMRLKAADLTTVLAPSHWTPRMLDKVLWTYGR